MGWQLTIWLCCVLYVVHLSCSAAVDRVDEDDDQLSDEVEYRPRDDSTVSGWQARERQARRRHRISQLDRTSLAVRRVRYLHRLTVINNNSNNN